MADAKDIGFTRYVEVFGKGVIILPHKPITPFDEDGVPLLGWTGLSWSTRTYAKLILMHDLDFDEDATLGDIYGDAEWVEFKVLKNRFELPYWCGDRPDYVRLMLDDIVLLGMKWG